MTTSGSGARRDAVLPSGERRPRYDLDRLLAVAVSVFTERGYDGTSLEHLAAASGLSKSSIYHHVPGKEQLLRLALERALDPLLATAAEAQALDGTPGDRLRHLIRRDVEVLAERLPYVTLLLRVHGNTETERWALQQRRGFDAWVAELVQQAVDSGEIRADVEALTTARMVFGLINSLVEWYRPSPQDPPERLAEQVISLVFDGLARPEPALPHPTPPVS